MISKKTINGIPRFTYLGIVVVDVDVEFISSRLIDINNILFIFNNEWTKPPVDWNQTIEMNEVIYSDRVQALLYRVNKVKKEKKIRTKQTIEFTNIRKLKVNCSNKRASYQRWKLFKWLFFGFFSPYTHSDSMICNLLKSFV